MMESRKASSPGRSRLLREPEPFVGAPQVDQELGEGRQRLSQDGVERRPEERIDPALQLHELDDRSVERPEEHPALLRPRRVARPASAPLYARRARDRPPRRPARQGSA